MKKFNWRVTIYWKDMTETSVSYHPSKKLAETSIELEKSDPDNGPMIERYTIEEV